MTTLEPDRLVEGLREQTAAFGRAVAGGDPEAKVPACPQWRLRDLVGHVGQATRWAAGLIRAASTPPPLSHPADGLPDSGQARAASASPPLPDPLDDPPSNGQARATRAPLPVPDPHDGLPGSPAAWGAWLRDGAEELIAAVRSAAPDAPVWSFAGAVPPAFWLRRMFCETAVHHHDAATTTGVAYAIADDLAADVITEALELVTAPGVEAFKPELAALRGRGERLAVRADGMPGWLITRTPGGPRWERSDTEADVVVSGPVAECMLVLARRVPPRRVGGDLALLRHWLGHTAF